MMNKLEQLEQQRWREEVEERERKRLAAHRRFELVMLILCLPVAVLVVPVLVISTAALYLPFMGVALVVVAPILTIKWLMNRRR